MLGKSQPMSQEGTNGTRNRDVKEQLRLGNERTIRGIYRKSTGMEIAKRITRYVVGLKRIEDWTLWRGRPPPKRKKKKAVRGGAGNVKAPAPTTTDRKRGDFIKVPLLTSAHKKGAVAMVGGWSPQPRKNPTRGNTDPERKRRRCKRSPRKKRNGDTPLGYSRRTALRRVQCGVPPDYMSQSGRPLLSNVYNQKAYFSGNGVRTCLRCVSDITHV
jgi:hypothetical protein